jgi:hypothetical protein
MSPTTAAPRGPHRFRGTLAPVGRRASGAAAVLLLVSVACTNEVQRAPGEVRTFVEEVLPAPRERVVAAVTRAFNQVTWTGVNENKYPSSDFLHGCDLFSLGNRFREWHAGSDEALLRYASVHEERRRDDLLLNCKVGPFWPSEYRSPRGVPLPFITDFIIHLDSVSPESTRVEVIEYFPQVKAGKRFGFGHDALLPGFIDDVRSVPPTTQDRLHVLDRIRQALRSP